MATRKHHLAHTLCEEYSRPAQLIMSTHSTVSPGIHTCLGTMRVGALSSRCHACMSCAAACDLM